MDHKFEQYSLFVESSYKVTEWRNSANGFFLSLNAATVALVGFGWEKNLPYFQQLLIFLASIMFLVCTLWVRLLLSFKTLNSAKFAVIERMEKDLHYKPFTDEWKEIEKKTGLFGYTSLSKLEISVACVIGLLHLGVGIWVWRYGLPLVAIASTHTP
jgi:hypothetical protein